MPAELLPLARDIYTGATTMLLCEHEPFGRIDIGVGVKQGYPPSTTLFNLSLEPVLRAALACISLAAVASSAAPYASRAPCCSSLLHRANHRYSIRQHRSLADQGKTNSFVAAERASGKSVPRGSFNRFCDWRPTKPAAGRLGEPTEQAG